MPEEKITAQTTADAEAVVNADDSQKTTEDNSTEFTDTGNPYGGGKAAESAKQTKEQNSENARRRREAERQAEIKKVEAEARNKAIIETLGGINPYTDEEMKDATDVEEYLTMREIEKGGGDPLTDFSKYRKKKERENAEKAAREESEREWFKNDQADFASKHPEVDIGELIEDRQFQRYAAGKVGNVPLSEIYDGYIELTSEYERKAKNMASQMLANQKASPGSLTGTNAIDSGFFTKEQVQKMSPKEVHENYESIRASMKKWK